MGLISGLLTLPLAPVRGVVWVAGQLRDAAEGQVCDPAAIRAQLAALNQDLEDGRISSDDFEREEERLLDLMQARRTDANAGTTAGRRRNG
jgi:hypothetical protein